MPTNFRQTAQAAQLHRILWLPPILQRLDLHLKFTRPTLWSYQLHIAAYLSLWVLFLAALLSIATPVHRPMQLARFLLIGRLTIVSAQLIVVLIWWRYQKRVKHMLLDVTQPAQSGLQRFSGQWLGLMLIFAALPLFLAGVRLQFQQRADQNQLAQDMLVLRIYEDRIERSSDNRIASEQELAAIVATELANEPLDKLSVYFGWVDYWVNEIDSAEARRFIERQLTSADIIQLVDAFNSEPTPLQQVVMRQGGQRALSIDNALLFPRGNSDERYELARASRNVFQQFRFGFDTTQPFVRNAWIVSAASAMHMAMVWWLAQLFKRRTILVAGARALGLFLLLFTLWLAAGPWDMNHSAQLPLNISFALLCVLMTIGLRQIAHVKHTQNKHNANMLTLIPFILAVAPFIIGLWTQTNGFDNMFQHLHDARAYSLRTPPLRFWWVEFISQFYFIPLIPFLYLPLLSFYDQHLYTGQDPTSPPVKSDA